jgi:hypothetical protein
MTWTTELVLIHSDSDRGAAITRRLWPRILEILDEHGINLDLPEIEDVPHFHLRFYGYWDGVAGYSEVLRLNRETVGNPVAEQLQRVARDVGARCAAWRDWNTRSHSPRFWSFLQACSILRVREGMMDARGLMTDAEAHFELCSADRPWSAALAPWVERMDTDKPNEYAHLFAHLMSDRGLGAFGLQRTG